MALKNDRFRSIFANEAANRGYTVGERIDIPATQYAAGDATIVLFARDGCAACEQMAPVLADLYRYVQQEPRLRMIAVYPPDSRAPAGKTSLMSVIGLPPADTFEHPGKGLRVTSVPSVLIVERTGTIKFVQQGIPQSDPTGKSVLGDVIELTSKLLGSAK